ncbi:MAG: VWA domain-containing protein [Sandaracinaceae bacterium]|nr:VWA domain-containing protein [Sandaracinaceae bacterium]
MEPLAIRHHRVGVSVRERVAETRVEQTFYNHTGQVLQATYIFPVPEGAAVSGFAMWVGGRRQEGELLDAGQARAIYEAIVARVRDPGLVEHMGGRLFRARVFPIQPNSEQRVEIRFSQTLEYQDSVIHYRYPLHTSGPATQTLEDFTFTADIISRTPIRAVYSPTHPLAVSRPDEHRALVGFETHQAVLDADLDLYYAVQDRDVGLSLLTHQVPGEDGYFLAMIAPRAEIAEQEIAAKEVVFVFDTSGSMAGDKLARAQAALDYMLARLNPADRFQVIRFSTDVEPLFGGGMTVPATPENVVRARGFAHHFVAAGGTAIHGALREGLAHQRPSTAARLIVFLTDGMPTVGETEPAHIVRDAALWAQGSRVYVFGVGDDVNTTFLDTIARRTGGVGDYFADGSEMERRLSAFYDRVAYPIFTDLELSMPGADVYDVYPRDLGHLYRGSQLMVVGRYRGGGPARVTLAGRLGPTREATSFAYPVTLPPQEARNAFLPRIWATRKIGFLLDSIRLEGERPDLRRDVVALAQRFGIVTPYTSYLVVEQDAVPPGLIPQVTAPTPETTATYDFEDSAVDGDLLPPQGQTLDVRPRAPRPSRSGGGGSSGGSRGAAAPSAPEAEAARDFEQFAQARVQPAPTMAAPAPQPAPSGGAGESGRRLARRLREMRETERTEEGQVLRYVAGRAFRRVEGMWVDPGYRRSLHTLHVRPGSVGWIALLRERPDLRPIFALGDRVAVAIDGHRAIIVDPSAPEGVSEAQVASFLSGD